MLEYRKAAEAAARRGDFRRAAYIYGILLQDDRMAATALERAGLHHDAAVLYANKLNDQAAAARAFDAAGEFDRALKLYRGLLQHEPAGDLLRRIGEEQAAIEEYLLAANLLATRSNNHLAAGMLMLAKARRPDLAIAQFQAGWDRRPAGNALACAIELARLHSAHARIEPIRKLIDQADSLFEAQECAFDGSLYDEIMRLSLEPPLEPFAEELRDRALQAFGGSLRRGVENRRSASAMVSKLLGRSRLWPAPLVSDADFAVEAALEKPRPQTTSRRHETPVEGLQIGRGNVTATCQASTSGEILLGFDSGLVCVFSPDREQVVEVPRNSDPVIALAVDPQGHTFAALYSTHRGIVLTCFSKRPDGSYRSRSDIQLPSMENGWLTPILPLGVERLVGVLGGEDLVVFDAASGMVRERRPIRTNNAASPATAFLLSAGPSSRHSSIPLAVFTHDGAQWVVYDVSDDEPRATGCRWQPMTSGRHGLRSVPFSWRHAPPVLELSGVDEGGAVHAAECYLDEDSIQLLASRVATTDEGYVSAAHAGTNMVVAASPKGIDWLSFHGDRFRVSKKVDMSLPSVVACFASHARDALVVCSRGLLIRVAAPARTSTAKNREPHRFHS
jgi:tetratricopeptide (TPR) repeat protein